ncbi:NAD(P)H-quinone oxidoreductase [Candidatus Binatia bacterium]|nr:NAD(P)H-quinone oxidoreductase [Candidatus Binatia bacterium]
MTETVPPTMRCVEISRPGGPEVLVPAMRPTPVPGQGEVLIRVAAAGINGPDIYQRKGMYPAPPGASDLPGLEIAGTIVAAGAAVDRWRTGDVCCALTTGGGYAEYCVAPALQCLPVPDGLEMTEAAALPETCFTVWSNIWDRAGLAPGETLLVHGGAGGIGTTAVQIAAALGHRVFATAAGPEHCGRVTALGAFRAVDFLTEDFVAAIKECTGGKGVDVILDIVGGDYVQRNISCLNRDGRLVNIAFNKGSKVEIDLMPVMLKRLTLTGSTLRVQSVERKGEIARALESRVWPLIASDKVRPLIYKRLPLADAAEGHRLMEGAQHIGKIVLEV